MIHFIAIVASYLLFYFILQLYVKVAVSMALVTIHLNACKLLKLFLLKSYCINVRNLNYPLLSLN